MVEPAGESADWVGVSGNVPLPDREVLRTEELVVDVGDFSE